jgi:hypothetical protein
MAKTEKPCLFPWADNYKLNKNNAIISLLKHSQTFNALTVQWKANYMHLNPSSITSAKQTETVTQRDPNLWSLPGHFSPPTNKIWNKATHIYIKHQTVQQCLGNQLILLFLCGLIGNSPLCGVELDMIHFSKTTDKATTSQLCQNVKLQFWSVGCHYLYHNNTVPGTNMLTLTYLVSHAEQQP